MSKTLQEIRDLLKRIDERAESKKDSPFQPLTKKTPTVFGQGGALRSIASSSLALGSGKPVSMTDAFSDLRSSLKLFATGLKGVGKVLFGKKKKAGDTDQPAVALGKRPMIATAFKSIGNLFKPSPGAASGGGGFFGKVAGKVGTIFGKVAGGAGNLAGKVAGGAKGMLGKVAGALPSGVSGMLGKLAGGLGSAAGGLMGFGTRIAALAGPIGMIAAATVQAVVALIKMPFALADFGESILESQRKLAEFSPSMAKVFAEKDIQDTFRNMKQGEDTADSAGNLQDSLGKLQDTLEPIKVLFQNLVNNVLSGFIRFVTKILEAMIPFFNGVIDGINLVIAGLEDVANFLTPFSDHINYGRLDKIELGEKTPRDLPVDKWLDQLGRRRAFGPALP